jgi:hypothetical protein
MAEVLVSAWLAGFIILLYDVLSKPAVEKGIYSFKTFFPHLISLREYLYRALKKQPRYAIVVFSFPIDERQNCGKNSRISIIIYPVFFVEHNCVAYEAGQSGDH